MALRNRAKCKLCNSILESFHRYDYVECDCGEISISGGNDIHECYAKDWNNFLRLDDKDKVITVIVKEDISSLKPEPEAVSKPSRDELLEMLDTMIKSIEDLPDHAKTSPISHWDYVSGLILLSEILRSRCLACKDATCNIIAEN